MEREVSSMKDIIHQLKNLILIGFIPVVMFWIGVGLSFAIFPEDIEAASNLLVTFAGAGCLVAIFLVSLNIHRAVRAFFKDKE